jgi:hypothetical protein
MRLFVGVVFFCGVDIYGNSADQIASNNQTIDIETERIEEDNLLQERDIKIRYLITVFQLNLIFLEDIFITIEIDESEK